VQSNDARRSRRDIARGDRTGASQSDIDRDIDRGIDRGVAAVVGTCDAGPMIRHVVMFRWADEVDDAHIDRVAAGLDALVEAIPEIRTYSHGRDLGLNAANHDYVVVADFESVEALTIYRDHPQHQRFIADLITGYAAERVATQYEH
jgi:Stress responsive A/B Barrel Domain